MTPDNEVAVVMDACVLVPMPLCDTLLRCAENPALFRILWSEETLSEVSRTLRKMGRSDEQAVRRIKAMLEAFPEASVAVPFSLLDTIGEVPDPHDRHVIAAAIHKNARVIVTANMRHFPAQALNKHGILAVSPDEFLANQLHLNAEPMLTLLKAQAGNRGEQLDDLIERFLPGMPDFVKLVRRSLS